MNAADVGVTVKDGVVTLTGTVRSYAEKREAEKVSLRLRGVRAVANELDVRLADDGVRSDSDIAGAVVTAIKWNVFLPDEEIKAKVEDGWVTLQGDVEWNYQRDRAEKAVRPLAGVRGVTNLIKVAPHASPTDISGRIRKALPVCVVAGRRHRGRRGHRMGLRDLRRAPPAGEPRLLEPGAYAPHVIALHNHATRSVAEAAGDRRNAPLLVLRQTLGYAWSVIVAEYPQEGKRAFERWLVSPNPDVRWLVRENLKKKRITHLHFEPHEHAPKDLD